ncbi:hypothetical protein [Granulicella sp. dw_53]|uniref:hypothetical protein n=1 Tax=Granulicella sp. dw_53 TaxID=2719792 RepID=UPI001BD20281|nr:hypothetical protein [Granulicella sp. dw_53]
MEEAADEVVNFLYQGFSKPDSETRSVALVRCFKTHLFGCLPVRLQNLALMRMNGIVPSSGMRCLTLLASRGDEPAWNGRLGSERHQVVPLPTSQIVEEAPMVSRLIQQMGLELEHVVGVPADLLVDLEQRSFNVFHVEEARGSEYVPAQETFVARHGVRSVLGMGGLLPSGDLFVVVMFSRVRITRETAEMFRTLALSVKLVLLPFSGGRVFVED